jgi:AraC-like DNA-binding protein
MTRTLNAAQGEGFFCAAVNFSFPAHEQLQNIFAYLDSHYCQDIGLRSIAQNFGYSPSYLTYLMRRLTGKTLYQWLVDRRMFQARYLLLHSDLAIHQVANAVGYEDTGHFIKHFRQHHGLPPKTWRNSEKIKSPLVV